MKPNPCSTHSCTNHEPGLLSSKDWLLCEPHRINKTRLEAVCSWWWINGMFIKEPFTCKQAWQRTVHPWVILLLWWWSVLWLLGSWAFVYPTIIIEHSLFPRSKAHFCMHCGLSFQLTIIWEKKLSQEQKCTVLVPQFPLAERRKWHRNKPNTHWSA